MHQNDIEKRISNAAQSIADKIEYPEKESYILSNESKKYRRVHFTVRRAILIASIIIATIVLSGITVAGISGATVNEVIDYFFGDPKFKEVQETGLVTTANMVAEKAGMKVELKSLFCDGDITYITISADGSSLDEIEPKRKYADGTEIGNHLINRIKDVYISNENGIDWKYSDKMYKKDSTGWSHGESSLYDGSKNGALLIFYASPKESTTVNIKVQFENDIVMEFKQIELKVIPVQSRDLSNQNYYVEGTGIVGHITEIKYSSFKTTISVDWEIESMSLDDMNERLEDLRTHTQQARINGKEYYIGNYGFLPGIVGSKPEKYTETYDIVGVQATPQDTIEIRVYNNTDGTIGTLDYILLTIPGEE